MDDDANDALHSMDTWRHAAIVPANASSVRSMAQRRLEAPTVTDDEDEDEEDDDAAADDDGGVADADNTDNHRLGPSRARQARSRVPSPVESQAGLLVASESAAARSGSGVPKSGAGTKRPRSRPPAGTCGSEPGELSFVPMPFASARTRATSSRRTRSSSPMDGEEEAAAEEASADEEDAPVANLPRPTWCRVPTGLQEAEVAPKMLAGHSVVAHSGFLFFFGGFDGELGLGQVNEVSHSNALYQYHPDTDDWCTLSPNRLHDPEQESPAARRHASLVFEGGSFYLYGGFNGRGQTLGDLWEFKLEARQWCQIMPSAVHRMPVSQLVGEDSQHYNGERSRIGTFGAGCILEGPSPRAEHTAVVFNNMFGRNMLIFGGYDGKKKLNDTYVFNLDSNEWYRPTNSATNAPNRRCKHSSVLYGGKVWVAAGFQYNRGDNYAHTDMHCLDLDTFTWSPVLMDAQCPVALQGHRAVVAGDSMFIVGGKVRDEHLVGPDGHCSGLNDSVYRYRFDVNRWSKLETHGTRLPPRQLHAAVTIPRDENVVSIFVCGGADKSRHAYFNDMWELRDIRVPHRVSSDCNHCQMTGSMVNNPKFSDVAFIVEGQRVYAHRFILFSRCDYFRCMFEAGMKESTADEINVPGIKHKVFLAVMQFIYTGNVTMPEGSLAVGLLQAADMFGLDALRGQCVAKIESALTVENAAYVCQVADTHNASHLKQYCISFILHNFRSVIETDAWSSLNAAELGREILRAYASCCTFDPGAFRKRARVR